MKYFKCAVCIVIAWFIFGSLRQHVRTTAPRSSQPSELSNAEMDDSDAALQNESKTEDQDFIQKWTQSHPQNSPAQDEGKIGAYHEDYFHVDQPDYFDKAQQKPAPEDHWGMDKNKSIGH
ncbi:MAG TPA: hypothetical protein VGO67_02250 [Verrucomicrobiae bacterium]|jgi:hypothetical protein